jgi:adenylate cyclase
MALEIERKFLLKNDNWRSGKETGILYRQGYLSIEPERVVRVRVADQTGVITIKGKSEGAQRKEFEYEIPLSDAGELLDKLCLNPLIEKYRYKIDYENFIWEIDEFIGDNSGLILAELELQNAHQKFTYPDWVGEEVTDDPKYYNSNLVENPYKNWTKLY